MQKIKLASWNIAGGRPIRSAKSAFDYNEEDINYFVAELKKVDPNIVCLQESHTNSERNIAKEIAKGLGMKNVLNTPKNKSHIDPKFMLGDAIVSKLQFETTDVYQYPDPDFELYFPDGRRADVHHKTLQVVKIGDIFIAGRDNSCANIRQAIFHSVILDKIREDRFHSKIVEIST